MLQSRYTWEAQLKDGTVITKGGDLSEAVRVSLIPNGSRLPRHDLVGVPFVRRFLRYFKRSTVGGFDKAAYFAKIESQLSDTRKGSRAARDAKGGKPEPVKVESKPTKGDECVQCIVMQDSRAYIRHSDGTVLITPKDFELYL